MPRTEQSIKVKIAREKNANDRQKRNLDFLYEVFAPDETDWKTRSTTVAIKALYKDEVRVHISIHLNLDRVKRGTQTLKSFISENQ